MVEEVLKVDPDFEKELQDPLPLEETPEYKILEAMKNTHAPASLAKNFVLEFDESLEGHISKLTGTTAVG